MVVRQADGARNVSQVMQNEIVDSIVDPATESVRLWVPVNTGSSPDNPAKWRDAHSSLQNVGLSWLADGVNRPELLIEFKSLQPEDKVELPFVPEFAHDLDRARKLVDGDFYSVMPISAEFVPSFNCPFRCQQCAYEPHKRELGLWSENNLSNRRGHMKRDVVRPLVHRLAEAGVRYMVVTGGGEPLINPNVTIEALHAAQEYGIETGLYTNGAFLRKHADALLKAKPRFIRVSVNAGSSKIHTEYHRPLAKKHDFFTDIMDGVRRLAISRQVGDWATEIGLSYIVNPTNYRDSKSFASCVAEVACICALK